MPRPAYAGRFSSAAYVRLLLPQSEALAVLTACTTFGCAAGITVTIPRAGAIGEAAANLSSCRTFRSNPVSGKRICMITHSFYESDNRVIRYAEALAKRGDTVDVLALRNNPGLPREEVINGVRLHRIQDRFGKKERAKVSFLWPLLQFLIASSRRVAVEHRRNAYDLVHVHNVPDFLVFAAWYPRLTGARVILDIHDILPEFYCSKFDASKDLGADVGTLQARSDLRRPGRSRHPRQ